MRSPVPLIAVLVGAQFLVVLDSLAVALALPAIGRDLALGPSGLAWVVNAYSLALAGGLLLAGRISDACGRRPTLLAGIGLLTGGALLAAAAPGGAALLAARAVQGLGAALAYPPALALTGECFPSEPWRSRAFSGAAVAGASGTVAGAVFGGVVTGGLGWPWVFGLTVPVGVALLALGARVLPRAHPSAVRRGLDLPGAALAAAAAATLVATLSSPGGRLAGVAAVVVLAGALVLRERGAADPLIPPALLRSRRLRGGCAGIAANSALYSAVVFVGTLQLQEGLGWSAARAGLAFLPVSAASLLGGALVPRLRRRLGSVPVAVGGLVLGTASLLLLAAAPPVPSYPRHLLPALLLAGLALTAAFVALTEHTVGGGGDHDRGVASGLFETATHVAGALSVATYAALLSARDPRSAYLVAACLTTLGAATTLALLRTADPARQRSGGRR